MAADRAFPESGEYRRFAILGRELVIMRACAHALDFPNRFRILGRNVARTVELIPRGAKLGHAERRIVERIAIHGQLDQARQLAGGNVGEKSAPGQTRFDRRGIAGGDREAARPGYGQIHRNACPLVVS